MFDKYNAILRKLPHEAWKVDACKGNTYVTTIHAVNSAIVKSSKLTKVDKLYRGVGGLLLPETLMKKNEVFGYRGGVELGFSSLTYSREVALDYSKTNDASPSMVFEVQMGMVDRGCQLEWLSQSRTSRSASLRR